MINPEDESFMEMHQTPPSLQTEANTASLDLLPKKSKKRYEISYNSFMDWLQTNNTNHISENILLAYFKQLSSRYSPPSLWSQYSMLKKTLIINRNINIQSYGKLIAFIKNSNVGYECKKSKIFKTSDINRFLNEAPDHDYLVIKVACIFGIMEASRRSELVNLKVTDIQHNDSIMLVHIRDSKNHKPRSYVIPSEYIPIIQKYQRLRLSFTTSDHFFLHYKHSRCMNQVIGVNMIGSYPKRIAQFLGLQNPELYTGHSFRRSSTTICANAGAGRRNLKDLGGWKSDKVVDGYIQDSVYNRKKIASLLTKDLIPQPSTSTAVHETGCSSQQIITDVVISQSNVEENYDIEYVEIVTPDESQPPNEVIISHPPSQNQPNETIISDQGHTYHLQLNNCTNGTINFNR